MTPNQDCEHYYLYLLKRMDQRELSHTTVYYLVKARALSLATRLDLDWKIIMPTQLTYLD